MRSADDQPPKEKAGRGGLEGTWELFHEAPPARRQVKIINQTHFVWVTYVREDGRPLLSGGGTYTFDGKTYKENYEFGGPALPAELVGKEQTFTAELDGDTWRHKGTLSNDFVVDETWHRVPNRGGKPAAPAKPERDRVGASLTSPEGAAPGEPAGPAIPPVAAAVPTSPAGSQPKASSPPATGSRPHADQPPGVEKGGGTDLTGKKVSFQVSVGSGSRPLELRGWFTVTPITPADGPGVTGEP
jgi:hypothetical protein